MNDLNDNDIDKMNIEDVIEYFNQLETKLVEIEGDIENKTKEANTIH